MRRGGVQALESRLETRPLGDGRVDTLATAAGTALIAYLIGSLPSAYLVGRLVRGIDVRREGEGNVGARNVFHEVGNGWGIVVFALDFGKGAAAALLFRDPTWQLAIAAVFLVVGHGFPVWLRFVGGKGMAAAGGFAAALFPVAALVGGAASGVVWLLTHRFLPTVVAVTVVTLAAAPLLGTGLEVVGAALLGFVAVAAKRILDEPRMRRIEAETGWDRERGGTRR
jgi:glycerol-3-phosphate acyltransferase PlsY